MMPTYAIIPARPADPPLLPAIELAAARLFDGHGLDSVPLVVTSEAALASAQTEGRLWVALAFDAPVGFAFVKLLETSAAHLEELDVHPDHGRRGLGRRLVTAVCEWAAARRYESVTLTTFRDIPWNMPFYASLGFEEIPPAALSAALASVVENEARRGLEPLRRVVMRRRLTRSK